MLSIQSKITQTIAPNALQGKTILITGASDGIGRVVAKSYAKHGASVILHGRDYAKLQQVQQEITDTGAIKPIIMPLDLNSKNNQDYQKFSDDLAQQIQQLDGILHNAGILGERVDILDYSLDVWDSVMTVNVRSPLLLTQCLLPLLQRANNASVLFASSGVGRAVREQWGAYSLSKIAIEHLGQLLALENKNAHIRYNCINPGATRTAMRASAFPQEDPMTLTTAEQLLPTYLYLMSDESIAISGESFNAQ